MSSHYYVKIKISPVEIKEFEVPKEVKVSVPKPTSIIIEGKDKMLVGEVAALSTASIICATFGRDDRGGTSAARCWACSTPPS